MKDTFLSTFKRSLAILNASQLRSFRIQVLYSIIYAILELLSVAVLIPLVAQLNDVKQNSSIFLNYEFLNLGEHLLLLIILIAVIFLIKNIVILFISSKQAQFASDISTELSISLFKTFYNQSWNSYVRNNTEDYIRKIKEVPSDFAHHVLHNIIRIGTDILTGCIIITLLSLTDFRTILVLFGMLIPVWLIYLLFRKTVVSNINRSFREITPVTSTVLAQSVESFMEAKVYNKQNYFLMKYSALRKTSSDYLAKLKAASIFPSLFFEVAGVLVILVLLFYTLQEDNQAIGFQLIALITIAVYKIFPILNRILTGVVQVMSFRYTIDEMENSKDVTKEKTAGDVISFNDKITLIDVSYNYRDENSQFELKNIHFEIKKDDFIVITGPSGSGKTTLLNICSGMLEGYSGEIEVDNKTFASALPSWNIQIGIVPQTPVILQDSIRKNIAFGTEDAEINDSQVVTSAKDATIYEFVQSLPQGFNTQLGENGLSISGGQRQCIALARALYNNPKVLLLDEPTNQLDEASKTRLLQSLKSRNSNGLTVILATHDLIALNYCSKQIELTNGAISKINIF